MKVKYSRFRHKDKQTSFKSPTGPRRQVVRFKLLSPRKRRYLLKFPYVRLAKQLLNWTSKLMYSLHLTRFGLTAFLVNVKFLIISSNKYFFKIVNNLPFSENLGHNTPLLSHSGHLTKTATYLRPQGSRRREVRIIAFPLPIIRPSLTVIITFFLKNIFE